jgi:hypothetical protein
MKKCYRTEYRAADRVYESYVWAASAPEAQTICAKRNIGEQVYGAILGASPATWRKLRGVKHRKIVQRRMHYLVFMGWVAQRSGLYSSDEVLGDAGWLHQAVHREHVPNEPMVPRQSEVNAAIYKVELELGFAHE